MKNKAGLQITTIVLAATMLTGYVVHSQLQQTRQQTPVSYQPSAPKRTVFAPGSKSAPVVIVNPEVSIGSSNRSSTPPTSRYLSGAPQRGKVLAMPPVPSQAKMTNAVIPPDGGRPPSLPTAKPRS